MLILLYTLLAFFLIVLVTRYIILPPVPQWKFTYEEQPQDQTECTRDTDCATGKKCFEIEPDTFRCVLTKTNTCNPNTGDWVLLQDNAVKCVCRYPDLVTQNVDGANCDIDVACGVRGQLRDVTVDPMLHGVCNCDEGYLSARDPDRGPYCKPMKERNHHDCYPYPFVNNECDCPDGTIDSESKTARQMFHPKYLQQFKKRRCLKQPCTFNVLNGKPLRHASLKNGGCWCDPLHGNFPVHLQVQHYLKEPGNMNACASILETEHPNVKADIVCYFYLATHEEPQCFIHFKSLTGSVTGDETLAVSFPWHETNPYHVILTSLQPRIYGRKCESRILTYRCTEKYYHDTIPNCDDIKTQDFHSSRYIHYNVVYKYPVCYYTGDDIPYLNKRIILNPLMIKRRNMFDLLFSYGIRISYEENKWTVSFAKSDRPDTFGSYPDVDYVIAKMDVDPISFRIGRW